MTGVNPAARALGAVVHRDLTRVAADGARIAVRTSEAAGTPKGILVYMNGTAAEARMFDGMGKALAGRGITSYSITSRTTREAMPLGDIGTRRYSDDLDRIVQLAAAEHPGIPVSVAGTSLGAVIAMHWNATRNTGGRPVLALAPVVLDRFLPFTDKLKLAGGLVSRRIASSEVATPMAVGRRMTTNPASDYVLRDLSGVTVPARVFGDVLRMNLQTLANRSNAAGPVQVVLAGADEVGFNPSARLFAKAAIPAELRTISTIRGAPHELSQEWHDPRVLDTIADFALRPAAR